VNQLARIAHKAVNSCRKTTLPSQVPELLRRWFLYDSHVQELLLMVGLMQMSQDNEHAVVEVAEDEFNIINKSMLFRVDNCNISSTQIIRSN